MATVVIISRPGGVLLWRLEARAGRARRAQKGHKTGFPPTHIYLVAPDESGRRPRRLRDRSIKQRGIGRDVGEPFGDVPRRREVGRRDAIADVDATARCRRHAQDFYVRASGDRLW